MLSFPAGVASLVPRDRHGGQSGQFTSEMSEIRWYVAATSVLREDVAEINLVRQGFRTFLPRRRTTVRQPRRFTTGHSAYFPGYIFISLDLERDRWRSINGTLGVKSLLPGGGPPTPVPKGFVESLIEATDEAGFVSLQPSLSAGARIKPLSGVFVDFIGTIDKVNGNERVTALFQVMNRTVRVEMKSREMVEAAW